MTNAIRLYLRTGMKANRAYTPASMLATAGIITGHSYKRGRRGLEQAAFDLDTWCQCMAATLPVVEG